MYMCLKKGIVWETVPDRKVILFIVEESLREMLQTLVLIFIIELMKITFKYI